MTPLPFYLGCAVWSYKDWIGDFFPNGSRSDELLRLYGRRLTAVEGNTTFYATPRPAVVERWAADTPETFRFCLKLPRAVSHAGALADTIAQTHDFVAAMAPLGARLGPFFLQLPPGYGPGRQADLAQWLAAWPAAFRLAVEVRHRGWYGPPAEAALMELLAANSAGRVLMDVRPIRRAAEPQAAELLSAARERKPDVPLHPLRSADIALVRYIGDPDLDRNEAFLAEWATRIADWLATGTQVYFFMHCPDERLSPALCRMFQQQLAASAPIPPLPWDATGGTAEQLTLL